MSLLDWIPAIGTGVGSFVSGLFGKASNDSANRANMKIAQMNNEWSERMMDKQNLMNIDQWNRESKFALDMWNRNNEYNSAKAQVQRYREAGLNPALMMGQGSAGVSQGASTPSGNSVGLPSPSQARVQPYDFSSFSNMVGMVVEQAAMLSRNQAEVNNLNAQTDVARAKARAEIEKMREETRNVKFRNELNDITKDLQITQMNEDYLTTLQQRMTAEQQEKFYKVQTMLMDKDLQAFDDRLKMDIAVMASQVDLNKSNAQSEVGKIIDTLQKKGYRLTKTDKKRIFAAVIQDIETQQYRGLNGVNTLVGLLNR